jgi:DNA polymerase bacteriophage-type
VLAIFRASDANPLLPDRYTTTAADIVHKDPRAVTAAERSIGKVSTLALGFGGSVGALQRMALNYRISFDDAEARRIVTAWREANPWAREFWDALWDAAMQAWELPGQVTTAGRIAFTYREDYLDGSLFLALPSGRLLTYPRPRWRDVDVLDKDGKPTGEKRNELSFRRAHGRAKLWHGTLCLAGDTLVLTESGWMRIDQLGSQRVWDGETWVSHGGVVCNGERAVIDFDGIAMTPDHLILTREGWKYACEGHRFERAPVQLPRSNWAGGGAEQEPPVVDSLPVRKGMNHAGRQPDTGARNNRLSILFDKRQARDTRHVASPRLFCLAIDEGPLPVSGLAQLRGPRDFGLQSLAGELREFLGGHGANLSPGIDDRADRQHGRLHAGELHLGDAENAGAQQADKPPDRDALGRDDSVRSLGAEQHWTNDDPLSPRPDIRSVFDILDAGRHHRFVVAGRSGPTLVHNCENAVQATAADLLRAAVTRIETNPAYAFMPIRMSTHDEIVCEVDEARADEAKALLRREMLTLPTWAAGLPLASEESVCPYYTKSKAALRK